MDDIGIIEINTLARHIKLRMRENGFKPSIRVCR